MGQLMRYQFRQYPTMLDRWANHVEHWVGAAGRANNIHIVRYEDLAARYDDTIKHLGRRLGMPPSRIVPPPRNVNVVQAGSVRYAPGAESDNRDAITELALARFPALMDRLGYGPTPASASAV
jgi:predicted metal-dependent phosphoesterase TrpH